MFLSSDFCNKFPEIVDLHNKYLFFTVWRLEVLDQESAWYLVRALPMVCYLLFLFSLGGGGGKIKGKLSYHFL